MEGHAETRHARWQQRAGAHLRTPLYQNAYALMASTAVTSALGIVYWLVAARVYPVEVVGINSALIAAMNFMAGLSQLNLRSALNRFVPVAGLGARRLVTASYFAIISLSVVFATLSILAVATVAPTSPGASVSRTWLSAGAFVVATAFWALFNVQDGLLTGLRKALLVPLENAAYSITKIVLLVSLAGILPSYGIFASWTISAALAVSAVTALAFGRLIPAHMRERPQINLPKLRELTRFIASDYLGSLGVLAYVSLLPVLVITFVGSTSGGYFYVVWTIASSLNLIPLSMAISHTAELSANSGDVYRRTRELLVNTVKLIVPLVGILLVVAPVLLAIFGDAYARAGTTLLRLMVIGLIPYAVNAVALSVARIRTQSRYALVVQSGIAVLALSATAGLLPAYGIVGVGFAWVAAQTAGAGLALATILRPLLRPHDPPDHATHAAEARARENDIREAAPRGTD
jgi:O-antigen/teichoic acid export membrane protein